MSEMAADDHINININTNINININTNIKKSLRISFASLGI